ncbi:MAG TPA: hypothetical protein VJ911_01610, partial [Cryomorphaceae bacterium]|nr:hypothetical protein [Cryomorphaceae bacterium]
PRKDSTYHFELNVKNNGKVRTAFGYKIFYQNASYKFPEWKDEINAPHARSTENFYGSWISDEVEPFRPTEPLEVGGETTIVDSFFISGNPINDPRYFSQSRAFEENREERINKLSESIRRNPEWYEAVEEKAKTNNISTDEQVRDDAIYILLNALEGDTINQRWKRNPRVGVYEFMIVVAPLELIKSLPDYIHNPLARNPETGSRVNPFAFFSEANPSLEKWEEKGLTVFRSPQKLKTYAVLKPSDGLYYEMLEFSMPSERDAKACAADREAFEHAAWKQYKNTEVRDSSLHNINVASDMSESAYTRELFAEMANKSERNIPSYVEMPERACENVWYDGDADALVVQNPGNFAPPYSKKNAGLEGRFGFTYGNFKARIAFPEILNSEYVWNGITCAYWLKFQSLDTWNRRNTCDSVGYLQSGYSREDAVYASNSSYTEIDIEIVKTSRHWPGTPKDEIEPGYNPGTDGNLMVTCTNWDLACQDPPGFHIGEKRIENRGKSYVSHRWSEYYKALTIKTERPHEESVGREMVYEIDWRPTEIFWRVGHAEVGYMNDSITQIPNNQMVPVMTQEFHYGHWWPTTPYPQGDIPYPAKPITGKLYEIRIE